MNIITKTLQDAEQWQTFVNSVAASRLDIDNDWYPLFESFFLSEQTFVVGQLGQSLDGRIATPTGESKYINGEAGLTHLHRLRALVDGVIIGVGTALADDPMLTVRKVFGPNPTRIVLDPTGKLGAEAKVWRDDGTRRIVITRQGIKPKTPAGVQHIALPSDQGQLTPDDIVAALSDHGIRRLLVEGGANTIARFIHAGQLQRLHLIVAPLILGSGRTGLCLNEIESLSQAIKPRVFVHPLDGEILFDCDLSACSNAIKPRQDTRKR